MRRAEGRNYLHLIPLAIRFDLFYPCSFLCTAFRRCWGERNAWSAAVIVLSVHHIQQQPLDLIPYHSHFLHEEKKTHWCESDSLIPHVCHFGISSKANNLCFSVDRKNSQFLFNRETKWHHVSIAKAVFDGGEDVPVLWLEVAASVWAIFNVSPQLHYYRWTAHQ